MKLLTQDLCAVLSFCWLQRLWLSVAPLRQWTAWPLALTVGHRLRIPDLSPTPYIFTVHCTLVQSAVLRLHVVRLSVTLVICDHIGWKSWKLSVWAISPTLSFFGANYPPTLRETWGNFGETRGGVGKNGVLENKSGNISETCKDGGKVTMEGL